MANTLTLINKKRSAGDNRVRFTFKCVVSGAYAQGGSIGTPGETLSFNTALNPTYIARPKLPGAPAGKLPANSDIRITRCPDGYDALVEQNAASPTQANYALRIFGSGNTELGTGAYAAGLTADTTGFLIDVDVPLKYN